MSVILLLIAISLTLALLFLAGFVWAVNSGQFEDTYTPAMRVLTDLEANPAGVAGAPGAKPIHQPPPAEPAGERHPTSPPRDPTT